MRLDWQLDDVGKSSLSTADLYAGNVVFIDSSTSVDIASTSAARTVVSMQSGLMSVDNDENRSAVKPLVSDFGCSVNIVIHRGSVVDTSCQTDLTSLVEASVSKMDSINSSVRELEADKAAATSTRKSATDPETEVG